MKPMIDSPDPDCKVCNDASFLFAAQDAIDHCPSQLIILQNRIDTATTDANVDLAWNYFCTSTCLGFIQKIDDDHTCCMGDYADTAMNIRLACKASSTRRYCGAEINNLRKLNCTQTSQTTCVAQTNCQWDSAAAQCYFNGDATAIASACTDCNKEYFVNYPGGGIYTPEQHAVYAAAYATFCTKIDDVSQYAQAAGVGYRLSADLSSSDVSTRVCAATTQKARMALRSNSVRVAESIRRKAMSAWANCSGDSCDAVLQNNFNKAEAIDTAAAQVCKSDSSGAVCAARVATSLATGTNKCLLSTLANGTCADGCAQTSTTVLDGLGCCAATYGLGGFYASKSDVSTVAVSQRGLGINFRNRSSTVGKFVSNEAYISYRAAAKTFVGYDGLSEVRSCAGYQANAEVCVAATPTRSYDITLSLNYNVMSQAATSQYIINAIKVDIASAIGVSAAQITSVSFAASRSGTVRILGVNYPTTVATIRLVADSDADNLATDNAIVSINRGTTPMVFPLLGPEVSLSYPSALKNGYTTYFVSALAQNNQGDSPLSAEALSDINNQNTSPPSSGNTATVAGPLTAALALIAVSIFSMV
eukprot:GILJ01009707.1.p1 GENE.GILJ01009707.1~~GILJ01009707.1.p1  ORF type:complete len:647 (-),score=107.17 GILJ01009707.1:122-1891(-)